MLGFAGVFAVVAGVLAVGGVFKLVQPEPTRSMFAALGLPGSSLLARLSGLIELTVGLLAFLLGGWVLQVVVALGFVVFAATTLRLIQLGDAATSCGCFGRLSSRPTAIHVAVDVVAAAVAGFAAAVDAPGFLDARPDLPAAGIPYLLLVALGTWLVTATLTVLPDTLVAARRGPAAPTTRPFEVTSVR